MLCLITLKLISNFTCNVLCTWINHQKKTTAADDFKQNRPRLSVIIPQNGWIGCMYNYLRVWRYLDCHACGLV